MRGLALLACLLCALSSAAQPTYTVLESGSALLRSYVGDPVEVRVRLRLAAPARPGSAAAVLAAPKKLPAAPWMELRQVRVSAVGAGEWDVRISLVSFAPGSGRLPPLDLGAIVLDGLTFQTHSILKEKKVDRLAPPRDQVVIPGTQRRMAIAAALLAGVPLAGVLLAGRLAHLARLAGARRRRARTFSRLLRTLRRLRARLDRLGGREFYFDLTAALRSYLERRYGLKATTATTRELGGLLRSAGFGGGGPQQARAASEAVEGLARLFERGDWVKFGAAAADRAELLAAAAGAELYARRLEEARVGDA